MDCLFCKIANRTLDSDIVYEDDDIMAFRDVAPQAPSHILLIPRLHIATLDELAPDQQGLIGHIMVTATTVAREQGLAKDGYRLVMNCKQHGGQTVDHIHLHLLGGRAMSWPPG